MTTGRRVHWTIQVGFDQGVAVSVDGERMDGPIFLRRSNQRLGAWGVGRHIYTGDVSIGLKGRIAFECPG